MNHLCLVVCFINIFVFSVNSAPATPAATSNIFDLIENYSAKNCPALSKNVLIDKNLTYLAGCRDVSLENVPAFGFDSMNAYLCVAILEADFRLCNALSNESYTVAKSFEELQVSITSARNNSADKVCTQLKNFPTTLNYSSDIGAKFAPWMSKFNEQLFGSGCAILCSDFGGKTNVFCSMLWYINAYTHNVQREMQQRNLNTVPSPKVSEKATSAQNLKPNSAEDVSIPSQTQKLNPAPAAAVHAAVKAQPYVKPHVEPQIKTTKATTTTSTESTSIKQLPDSVSGDKEIKSQPEPKAAVGVEKNVEKAAAKLPATAAALGQVPADKEPVASEVKPKEVEQIEKQNIEVKLPNDVVETSAPEPLNTAAENKFETPATKEEEPAATNKNNPDMETTDKVVNGIFDDTTVLAGFKDAKQESYIDEEEDGDGNFKIDGLDKEQESAGAVISDQSITPREYADVEDSNFFAYFMFISVVFIAGYVLYHNKQKILALVLEGRRDRNTRRRPNTASYRKLNSNLEEAVTSKCSGSAAHVIY